MSGELMSLERLAAFPAVNELVGSRPSHRWGRACLKTRRSDGCSIAMWFECYEPEERVRLVREALLGAQTWSPLLRVTFPKKPGSADLRSVDMPIVCDQARLYILGERLTSYAEMVLTRVAVAFRRGVRMSNVVLSAQRKVNRLPIGCVVDIAAFFDSIPWAVVDEVIDAVPGDENVRRLLKALVRVDVVERRSGRRIERARGIPQGLSVSPVLANLSLNAFDHQVAHAISKDGAVMRRYCDDLLLLAPTPGALEHALRIVKDRLAKLGLTVKAGTGRVIDTRQEPLEWLGLSLGPDGLDVPMGTIDGKLHRLQQKLDHGILSPEGVQDSLSALHRHYGRILAPERADEVIRSIAGRLVLPARSNTRKEDINHLRTLVGHTPDRGSHAPWALTWGQPGGTGGDERITHATDGRAGAKRDLR